MIRLSTPQLSPLRGLYNVLGQCISCLIVPENLPQLDYFQLSTITSILINFRNAEQIIGRHGMSRHPGFVGGANLVQRLTREWDLCHSDPAV